MNKVLPFVDKSLIKVITGQRRCGKSYLMLQIIDLLKERNVKEANIISINKENSEFSHINSYKELLKYVELESRSLTGKIYLFIDEVQEIKEFERAVRSLILNPIYDVYITGSNAGILSSDLASYLSGRYIEIQVFPLTFKEFVEFHKLKNDKDSFNKYLKYGGLPYLANLELNDEVVFDYLNSVYNTILFKDIVKRFSVRNSNFLESLIFFMAQNIATVLTANKISDYLTAQKINISTKVVLTYLSYLEEAFFITEQRRIDLDSEKIFETGGKYFFGDIGLKNSICKTNQLNIESAIQNAVFLELRAKNKAIYFSMSELLGVDFIVEGKDSTRSYLQVRKSISEENKDNIVAPLLNINDNYEKIVLTLDDYESEYKGIRFVNLIEYLTK